MNMIFYIIGIVFWGYGIRLAVTSGLYLDSIFFVIVGGQAVRIGETIADGVELARWKEYNCDLTDEEVYDIMASLDL